MPSLPRFTSMVDFGRPPIGLIKSARRWTVTGRTGHKCPRSGIWQGVDAHRQRIALSLGETFPPCSGCGGGIAWSLIQPT